MFFIVVRVWDLKSLTQSSRNSVMTSMSLNSIGNPPLAPASPLIGPLGAGGSLIPPPPATIGELLMNASSASTSAGTNTTTTATATTTTAATAQAPVPEKLNISSIKVKKQKNLEIRELTDDEKCCQRTLHGHENAVKALDVCGNLIISGDIRGTSLLMMMIGGFCNVYTSTSLYLRIWPPFLHRNCDYMAY